MVALIFPLAFPYDVSIFIGSVNAKTMGFPSNICTENEYQIVVSLFLVSFFLFAFIISSQWNENAKTLRNKLLNELNLM